MIELQDWGLIEYEEAWQRQKQLVEEVQHNPRKNFLVLCEHPSVITIGRNGTFENVVIPRKLMEKLKIQVVNVDRGGDVTLHNPGQLVGYPIFNLENFRKDLHWFLREIEQTIIELLKEFNIESHRMDGYTGVWIEGKWKICAMGLHCSRWITSHGFALNVNNDLKEFDYIVPCGIKGKEVTSMEKEIGTKIDFNLVKRLCFEFFEKRFLKET